MRTWMVGTLAAAGIAALPVAGTAQLEFSVAPAVYIDAEFSGGNEVGPALDLGLTTSGSRPFGFSLSLIAARTDFPVGTDELHRNHLSGALGVRWRTPGSRSLGVALGLGVLVWDDVSETDGDFRSSANAEEMFQVSLEGRVAVGDGWGLQGFVRDQLTGFVDAVFDPEEGYTAQRFVVGAGVWFR